MKLSRNDVIHYYEASRVDYKLVWHLGSSLALHMGLWEPGVKSLREALRRENQVMAELVDIKPGDRVLDAGCGVGGSAIYMARYHGASATGISITPSQVHDARRNAIAAGVSDQTRFEEADYTKTGFVAGSFDVVWAIESVCHADSKEDFIHESYRLLRPGGRLVVADCFNSRPKYNISEATLMARWLNGWGVNALETTTSFRRYLEQAGFENIAYHIKTSQIMPSARRLHRLSVPALAVSKAAEAVHLRNKTQTGNVVAARWMLPALEQGLAEYGIFTATKLSH